MGERGRAPLLERPGSLKYWATASRVVSFWPTIQSTMKSAIIVVTKSE